MVEPNFRYAPMYWGGLSILFSIVVLAGIFVIDQQRVQQLTEARRHAQGELNLIGFLARESLRKNDYQTVENFIQSWGQEHQEVVILKAVTANGFVLGHYRREQPAENPHTTRTRVQYAYSGSLQLELEKDFNRLHQQFWRLLLQFAVGTLLFLLALGQYLWVTQRREAERQSRHHQAELAHVARLSTMGEMVSGIAHEINQPLTSMVTYAQTGLHLLELEQPDRRELKHLLEEVAAQGLRAGEIILRLKKFTRKGELKRTYADINSLVRNVADLLGAEVRERHVSVRLELGTHLPRVRVDTIQLEQVILNLMRNAMESMAEADVKAPSLLVTTSRRDDAIEVAVHDVGPGIDEKTRDRMFDPFFTTKSHGMGLGLAISRSLIEAHGGHMWVDSREDRGTGIYFSLPLARPGKVPSQATHSS
jgi:C4-dicarboxylate-specific signal transduction histidine kinase